VATYIYSGDISAQQLFDVDDYDNPLQSGILDSILRNTRPSLSLRYAPSSIPKDIVNIYSNNYASKVEQFYRYGRNRHSDDLPTNMVAAYDGSNIGGNSGVTDPHPSIQGIIEGIAGEEVRINYYYYGRLNVPLYANQYLVDTPQYELHSRNVVTASKVRFFDVNTGKIYIPDRYEHVGFAIIMYAYETVFVPRDPNKPFEGESRWDILYNTETTFFIPCDYSPSDNVHQVLYNTLSVNEFGTWYYKEDGTYPDIDGTVPIPVDSGVGYPFAMLIENGKNVNKGAMGEEYKEETNNMLSTIDLNLDQLMESLSGNPDPTDPDYDPDASTEDIKDAFLLYSINLDNDTEGTLKYMYAHFRDYYVGNYLVNDQFHQNWVNFHTGDPTTGLQLNAMHFYNNRAEFSLLIRWSRMRVVTGTPGVVGQGNVDFPVAINLDDVYPFTSDPDPNYVGGTHREYVDPLNTTNVPAGNEVTIGKVTKEIVIGTSYDIDGNAGANYDKINDHYLVIRKQLTINSYVEIVVMGPAHYTRLTGFHADGSPAPGVVYSINDLASVENGKMFIPLSYEVTHRFNSIVRSQIFYESLTIVVHVFEAIKLKWYLNPSLWIIVRIIVLIATWGNSEIWTQGLWEIAKQLAYNYLLGILVSEALMLLVDVIGGEAALIIAAIAATYAIVKGGGGDSASNALFNLMSAQQLLQGATLLVQAVKESTQDDFLRLETLAEEHLDYIEDEKERIEDLEALVSKGVTIDLASSVTRQPIQDLYETPTDFFNRSVHLTNPGVLSLDTIDSYTNNTLVLPQYKPQ
jgi:hypothetical protein